MTSEVADLAFMLVIFSGPREALENKHNTDMPRTPEEVLNTIPTTVHLKTCFIEQLTMYLFLSPFFFSFSIFKTLVIMQ